MELVREMENKEGLASHAISEELEEHNAQVIKKYDSSGASSKKVKQGYMVNDESQVVRVRSMDDDHFLTIKSNTRGLSRFEFEYKIPKEDAQDMFKNLCGPSIIEKTRHYIKTSNHTWEIDEFHDQNQGLIVAEIELKAEDEKFHIPNWIFKEVTTQSKYYNMNLIKNPYCDWKDTL